MSLIILVLGYIILDATFDIKLFGIEWLLSTIAMTLAYLGGTLAGK